MGDSWKGNSPARSQKHLENWVQGHWNLETSYALLARTRDILGGNVEQVTGEGGRAAAKASTQWRPQPKALPLALGESARRRSTEGLDWGASCGMRRGLF